MTFIQLCFLIENYKLTSLQSEKARDVFWSNDDFKFYVLILYNVQSIVSKKFTFMCRV
jgi:hypothetical protein